MTYPMFHLLPLARFRPILITFQPIMVVSVGPAVSRTAFGVLLPMLLTHNLDITTNSLSLLEQTLASMKIATSDHRLILYRQRPRLSIMGPILRRGAPMITLPIMVLHS